MDSSDARSFKPRPDQLVVDENEQESTIDVEDSRPGVYRPPQLSQTKLVDKSKANQSKRKILINFHNPTKQTKTKKQETKQLKKKKDFERRWLEAKC